MKPFLYFFELTEDYAASSGFPQNLSVRIGMLRAVRYTNAHRKFFILMRHARKVIVVDTEDETRATILKEDGTDTKKDIDVSGKLFLLTQLKSTEVVL